MPTIFPSLAVSVSSLYSSVGFIPSDLESIFSATPATWGAAIEVPEMVRVAVEFRGSSEIQAAVIRDPGAIMSAHSPQLLK
jgi:hypothetical protein